MRKVFKMMATRVVRYRIKKFHDKFKSVKCSRDTHTKPYTEVSHAFTHINSLLFYFFSHTKKCETVNFGVSIFIFVLHECTCVFWIRFIYFLAVDYGLYSVEN